MRKVLRFSKCAVAINIAGGNDLDIFFIIITVTIVSGNYNAHIELDPKIPKHIREIPLFYSKTYDLLEECEADLKKKSTSENSMKRNGGKLIWHLDNTDMGYEMYSTCESVLRANPQNILKP